MVSRLFNFFKPMLVMMGFTILAIIVVRLGLYKFTMAAIWLFFAACLLPHEHNPWKPLMRKLARSKELNYWEMVKRVRHVSWVVVIAVPIFYVWAVYFPEVLF